MIPRRRGSILSASLLYPRRRLLVMRMSHYAHSSVSIVQPARLACRPSSLQDPSSDRHLRVCPSSQRRSTEEEGRRPPWQAVRVPPGLRPLFLPARSFYCRPWRLVRARRQTGTRCAVSAVHGGCAAGGAYKKFDFSLSLCWHKFRPPAQVTPERGAARWPPALLKIRALGPALDRARAAAIEDSHNRSVTGRLAVRNRRL